MICLGFVIGLSNSGFSEVAPTNHTNVAVFFMQAVDALPKIRHFIASQEVTRVKEMPQEMETFLTQHGIKPYEPRPPTFFEGAISDNNFFYLKIGDTNSELGRREMTAKSHIVGRN